MAIEIGPIIKPTIWLVGTKVETGATSALTSTLEFAERVDHSTHLNPVTTQFIGGVSQYDEDNLLTFDGRVRIVITQLATPKPVYNEERGDLGATEFEGNRSFSPDITEVGRLAETWYTVNGKDPVRTKANLYNYLDLNDAEYDGNPSNDTDNLQNLAELGFVISASPTGNNVITLKARTFQYGNKSNVAIARFKIVRPQNYPIFEGRDQGTR